LGDVLGEQGAVAALELRHGRLPLVASVSHGPFGNIQRKLAGADVQRDEVPGLNQSQRAPDERLRGHVQDAGSVAGAAHPSIGDPHHVADALGQQVVRDRQHAVLGHAGPPLGPGVTQHQDGVRGDVQGRVVDPFLHLVVVVEDDRGAGVLEKAGFGRDVLDDRAVGRQVPPEDRDPALAGQRRIGSPDDVVVIDRCVHYIFAERAGVHRWPVWMQRPGDLRQLAE
jgi:hypothetical protein